MPCMSIGARPARRRFSRSATSKSWIATLLLLGASVIAPLFAATGTLQDVEHVVIFMQENRSFDHYYGTLRGIRGFSDTSAVQLTNGNSTLYQPNGKNYILPFHLANQCVEDLNHSWSGGHEAWHNGRWDRWVSAKTTTTMAYYTRAEIPFHYALADAFTVCDAYHCSVLGPSNPNRMYLWTGMIDPRKTGGGPVLDNSEPAKGYGWTTYPERLEQAGVSWKVYQEGDNFDDNALAWFTPFINALPGSALFNKGMARATDFVSAFRRLSHPQELRTNSLTGCQSDLGFVCPWCWFRPGVAVGMYALKCSIIPPSCNSWSESQEFRSRTSVPGDVRSAAI